MIALTAAVLAAPDAGTAPRFTDPAAAAAVAAMEEQTRAWNRGDLDAFCAIYADDAVFVSPSGVRRGRAEVLAGYKRKYTSRALMGALSFEFLDARVTEGGKAVSVAARWILKREGMPDASGHTLVVLFLRSGSWTIVQDASM
jgi:uncharacterized protein (TIGR02246 family)